MIRTSHLLAIFIPALIVAGFTLFIQILHYQPLIPKVENTTVVPGKNTEFHVPISADDPILGERTAGITLVAFEDFGCESCQQQHALLTELMTKYPGRIKIIWKGLPVARFPIPSRDAHRYAYCANKQGQFERFTEFAFANFDNLTSEVLSVIAQEIKLDQTALNECLSSGVSENYITAVENMATVLNIQSVPVIFMNDKQIDPPGILEGWEALLELSAP